MLRLARPARLRGARGDLARGLRRRGKSSLPATTSQDSCAAAWEKTYAATTQAELDEAYAAWAPTYDEDSIGRFGYAAPEAAAECLARHLSP
eukprot:5376633-Prymnesium_polylepis.1